MRAAPLLLSLSLLSACGSGEWTATTWGEDYIESGIPASAFADGCAVTFDTFDVAITEAALLDGDGEVAGEVEAGRIDMHASGPHTLGTTSVPSGFYDRARFTIAPTEDAAVHAAGSLTCGETTVTFDWSFDTTTTYLCEPADLQIPSGGTATTELTVHGDHLFYDGLENADAEVRGQAIVDADADEDGIVTLDELAAVEIAPLGYAVGRFSEVNDLAAFVAHLTRTVGHVDGEGHCTVDL